MSLTLSNPVHQQMLRSSQQLAHRFVKIWMPQRQAAYDFRDKVLNELQDKINFAVAAGQPDLAKELEAEMFSAHAKIRLILDRFTLLSKTA
jgi:hypothetical protein